DQLCSDSDSSGAEGDLDPATITGVKSLQRLFPLLQRLAPAGTERDVAGNRQLLFSQYAGLVLLGMFNPTLQSLRGLSEMSRLRKVQKALGGPRASLGSLSESVRVFDPELLEPIFRELFAQLPAKAPRATGNIPLELVRRLTAVDGSALRALPQIVAAVGSERGAKWRLHLQFEVHREIPEHAALTPDETGGDDDERSVLSRNLRAGRAYLLDRGYERYRLFNDIVAARSDYVCRVQHRTLVVVETRELSSAARDARVISDEVVTLPGATHPVRRVILQKAAQGRRRTDKSNSDKIVLLTNLCDVPAEIIAALYELRWSIELFFRFFKHVLGCRHLLSHKPEGVMIQVYCALIAALLLSLTLDDNVGRRGFELICLYLQGWAEEDELLDGLRRLTAKQNPPN
ncbi:MAG: IS4 family transposase, partial [Planctomycetales bacterium]|nr:IS4 family transposase [Planctomycetales bacterium]